MSKCISTQSSSASLMTTKEKLQRLWKTIKSSNPLLVGLIDVESIKTTDCKLLQKVVLETDTIMKRLGQSVHLSLFEKESTFYYYLCAGDADVCVKMSSKNEPQMFVINNNPDEITEEQANTNDTDKLTEFIQTVSTPEKLPRLVFSAIGQAFQYYSSEPRHSKEACVLNPCLPALKSSLDIRRGDILCVKRHKYENKLGSFGAFYHFGIYVGETTINESSENSTTLENAVIDLNQDENGEVVICSIPLVSDKKGEGFLYYEKESNNVPLFFKAVYEHRTREQKELTASRAEEICRHPDKYKEKYSLLSNNCEHFTNVCAFGAPYCEQHARFMLTTIPGTIKAFSTIVKIARWPLLVFAESYEHVPKAIAFHASYIGEAVALGMLLIECVGRILWDIYLLKKSNSSTSSKIKFIIKKRLLPMVPELLSALGFLLAGILCTVTGPVGVAIGISGLVVQLLLRFFLRTRIEHWMEEREAARRENFLKWHPSEVARLVMKAAADDDPDELIVAEFEKRNLSGGVIAEIIRKERAGHADVSFDKTFQFLNSERFKIFTNNVNSIFGHLTIDNILSSVTVTHEGRSFVFKRSSVTSITVHQLLEMARLNWQIDYAKGQWGFTSVDSEDGTRNLLASSITDKVEKSLDLGTDASIVLELSYTEAKSCVVQ